MADEDATRTGAEENKDEEAKPEIDMTNFNAVEAIAGDVEDAREEEEGFKTDKEGLADVPEGEKDPTKAQDEEGPDQTTKDETKAADETTKDKSEEELVEITVDGEKKKVPLSKIVDAGTRTLQKETAADSRLEEATRLNKEAKANLEESKKTQVPEKDLEKEATPKDAEEIKALRTAYIHATQYGTPEEADEAMQAYEDANKVPGVTITKKKEDTGVKTLTIEEIKAELKKEELLTNVNADPEKGGFSDIMGNPILKDQFSALVDNLVSRGQGSFDSLETYKKAGETIRTIGNTLDPEYTPPVIDDKKPDTFDDKRKKKEKIVNLKSASAKLKTESEEDEGPDPSASDTIAEMRKERERGLV